MINQYQKIHAFAPATCANVAVGFDILGFALETLGDEVILEKSSSPGLTLSQTNREVTIPLDPQSNTATVALQNMLATLNIQQGFHLTLKKNIPLSSGLGGSAASAVAALIAANGFLTSPLSHEELVPFALEGEAIACGSRHGDNIIPSLWGGLTLIETLDPLQVHSLPIPDLTVVLIKADWQVNTREARALLPQFVSLDHYVRQTGRLAAFVHSLYTQDQEALSRICKDEVIEPRRAHLIPYFYEIKELALKHGALCCSISGSGPAVFAFCPNEEIAAKLGLILKRGYNDREIDSQVFISPIARQGAFIVDRQ